MDSCFKTWTTGFRKSLPKKNFSCPKALEFKASGAYPVEMTKSKFELSGTMELNLFKEQELSSFFNYGVELTRRAFKFKFASFHPQN